MRIKENISDLRRVEWVDAYKGILIILVVVGHATGNFNSWIYQFHMAAFFFISGYLNNLEKKSDLSVGVKKIISIFFPFMTFLVIGSIANQIISVLGIHEFLFGSPYVGIKTVIKDALLLGIMNVQYLGTFWFLATLLGIELLELVLFNVNGRRFNCFLWGISGALFFLGYWLVGQKAIPKLLFFELDLIFIAQGYYNLGVFVKKYISTDFFGIRKYLSKLVVLISCIVIVAWGKANRIFVDYPSRHFRYPFAEFIVALASICIIYFIAKVISDSKGIIKRIIISIGKKSLGIMALHFIFFKFYMIFLYKAGKADAAMITGVVLPGVLSSNINYWGALVIFSVGASLIAWSIIVRVPVLKFLVGQDKCKNEAICKRISENRVIDSISEKICEKINSFWGLADEFVSKNKAITISLILIVFTFMIPMYRTGIITNDELQARCLAMNGLGTFYSTEFFGWINQGRFLAAPINSLTKFFSFIGADLGTSFRVGSIIILLGVVFSYYYFIYIVLNDEYYARFSALIALACMPIAFEHMPPNAFVGFIAFSFMLVLISGALYTEYIYTRKKRFAVVSMILFLITMMSYEAFVTFSLLFLLIVLGKTGITGFKDNIRLYLIPVVTTVIFLVSYVLCGKLAPSNYEGNHLGFDSIFGPLVIILNLFIVCIPGFFVFFPKYQYLKEVYFNMELNDYLRVIVFVIAFAILSVAVIKPMILAESRVQFKSDRREKTKKRLFVVACAISYMILPSLPNSIATLYQGNVGFSGGFLTLPITFIEYFAAVFVVSYLLWLLMARVGKKYYVIVIALICVLVANVQEMNDIFSKEQNENFCRLVTIEDCLKTDTVASLKYGEYFSNDLYQPKNLLLIHEGYWNTYCNNVLGLNIQISSNRNDNQEGDIFYDDDNFVIVSPKEIVVLSKDQESGVKAVHVADEEYRIVNFDDEYIQKGMDNDFYVYSLGGR